MLDSFKSQVSIGKSFSVGGQDVGTWGGLQPVYVTTNLKSFCWEFDYSKLKISETFELLLRLIDMDPTISLSFRFRGYTHYICQNPNCGVQDLYLPVIESGTYHPYRSWKHTSRCVNHVMNQIEFLEKNSNVDYLICLDLTCPGEISKLVMDPAIIKRLRRAVNLFIENLRVLLFHEKRSRLGGFYSIHIWKTSKPLDPHLHVHLQLFNVAYNSRENSFYRFKPMLSHLYVKQAWRDALRSQGLWDDPLEQAFPDCHLHYLKLQDRERLIHRLRYVFRRPLIDLNTTLTHVPPDPNPVWVRYLLDYVPRRVKIGFMANLKRMGFICYKSFFERCPICGGILRALEFVPGNLPDVPHFIHDRSGSWVPTEPPPWIEKL